GSVVAVAQAGCVVGDGGHFLVGHLERDVPHHLDRVVGAAVITEGLKLGQYVLGVLASQSRKQGRQAGAGRTVAGGTGGNAFLGDAAAPDLAAQLDGVIVLCDAVFVLLLREVLGEAVHVVVGQRGD